MLFDWQAGLGKSQSITMHRNGKNYWLVASHVGIITDQPQFQAMCDGVRVTKELFPTMVKAKLACEEWYLETIGQTWDAKEALDDVLIGLDGAKIDVIRNAILSNFTIAPRT